MNQPSLDQSPKKKSSWIINFIFCLLALAFVATSIDTQVFLFESPVVSIGNKRITESELRQLFIQESALMHLEHPYGMDLDPTALLNKIERNEVLNLEVDNLKIHVSQEAAKQDLYAQKAFQNTLGQFDQAKLNKLLSDHKMSLKQLIDAQKKAIARNRLKKALLDQVHASQDLLDLTVKGMFQKRKGAYKQFMLTSDERSKIQPTASQLRESFDKNPILSPEQRTYSILFLSADTLPQTMTETEQKKNPQAHGQKAREHLETMSIQIEDGLGAGKSLKEIADQHNIPLIHVTSDDKGFSVEGEDLFLGAFPSLGKDQKEMTQAILNKVFSTSSEQGVEFLQLTSSTHVWIHVNKVTPPQALTYDQAKSKLVSLYREAQEQRLLREKAKYFLAKKGAGSDMMPIDAIGQEDESRHLPEIVKQALFQLTPGASSFVSDGKKVYGVKLLSVSYSPDPEKSFAAQEFIREEWYSLFWSSYLTSLMKKYPITEKKGLRR
jgi:hypothetical protein